MLRNSTALVLSLGLLPLGAHAEVDLNALLRDFNAARQMKETEGGAQTRLAPDLRVPFWPIDPSVTPSRTSLDDTLGDAPAPPTVLPAVKVSPDMLPGPPVAQPVPDGYARLARQAAALLNAWAADRAQTKE